MLPVSRQSAAALHVLQTLRAAGHQAYLAGGCVRDLLLGREPKDYDVATSATPDVVLALFPRTFAVGAHFGVVLVATCGEADAACAAGEKLAEQDYLVTEVATFRSDGVYSDGRHPDAVKYTLSAEEDVRRRDFTINGLLLDPLPLVEEFPAGAKAHVDLMALTARLKSCPDTSCPTLGVFPQPVRPDVDLMALTARLKSCPDTELSPMPGGTSFSPVSNTPIAWDGVMRGLKPPPPSLRSAVIDYVGGLADLESGIVRAIGNPGERFEEDHLRMLRGVRFASRFGFQIDPATAAAIRRLAPRTKAVSRERVRDELTKMLTEGHARRAFELLDETALLAEVLPEIARMKGVEQPPQFHPEGDVWAHTLMLLGQLEPGCPLTLAWGALLHDVGKPPTFRRAPDRIRFDGHAEVGVAMAAEICRRFRFSNDETRQILALVENHMRFMDAPRMKASTLKRFFRLDGFDQHLALHRMDCLAGSGHLDNWNFVRDRLAETPAELVRPTPLITGRELIAAGYRPGAAFKQMLQVAEDAQLEGTIATPDEALRLVRERFPAVSD